MEFISDLVTTSFLHFIHKKYKIHKITNTEKVEIYKIILLCRIIKSINLKSFKALIPF